MNTGDTDPVADLDALVNRYRAADRDTSAPAVEDELAHRRADRDLARLLDRHARRTPEELARMDAEMTVFTDADQALHDGRAAFRRGDWPLAEHRLQIAAAHDMGDAIAYLAALHQHLGNNDLATAWKTIATHHGFDDHIVNEIRRKAATDSETQNVPPS
ncbi:hypothetical protein [Amycolatopsis sp. cmx-4-54]|uniref:hypothetical protein n=1 Tax=Amycolatopsis sp. cmx-4-54 TaxID=2790936 RepID=UPI00397BF1F2